MVDLLSAQKETILGQINEVYQKKDFVNSPIEPVERWETVIGVLTDYEKAVFSLHFSISEKSKNLENNQEQNKVDDDHQLIIYNSSTEALRCLLWVMIRERLGKKSTEKNKLAIRDGWQIVSSQEEASEDLFSLFGVFIS